MSEGEEVWAAPCPYRVDGEIGRFEFVTYWGGTTYNTAHEVFPPLQGKQWYQTRGYKEVGMIYGATSDSYRKTSAWLNRIRYQQTGGTPSRTLREQTMKEGERVQQDLVHQTAHILLTHGIVPVGEVDTAPVDLPAPTCRPLDDARVQAAIRQCQAQAPVTCDLRENPLGYEDPASTVNICIDDVGTKRQAAQRSDQGPAETLTASTPPARKTVQHTVVHVEQAQRRYVLTGAGLLATLRLLLAFLLHNACLSLHLQVFIDGYRPLHEAIGTWGTWYPHLTIILDWYHLYTKCQRQLSLAMSGRDPRNAVLKFLLPLLWYGLVDHAIEHLTTLNRSQVKNADALTQLIGYFERNRACIPCYAVRKALGLRNSSQLGEKMNDLIVADRQKHRGMSWSADGSVALASLTALKFNQEASHWFEYGNIPFQWAA